MNGSDKVFEKLKKLKIDYEVINHPDALTMEEADKYIEGKEGVRTKTLFLCSKKKERFYLVALDEDKRLDLKRLSDMLNEKSLRFASNENLIEVIGLPIGMVSVFGILNDETKSVTVVLDEEMNKEGTVTFYANDPGKTVFIDFKDVAKFVLDEGNELLIEKL